MHPHLQISGANSIWSKHQEDNSCSDNESEAKFRCIIGIYRWIKNSSFARELFGVESDNRFAYFRQLGDISGPTIPVQLFFPFTSHLYDLFSHRGTSKNFPQLSPDNVASISEKMKDSKSRFWGGSGHHGAKKGKGIIGSVVKSFRK